MVQPIAARDPARRAALGLAIGAAALFGGAISGGEARAQGLFWFDRPAYEPAPPARQKPAQRRARHSYPKVAAEPKKDAPKPEGPLVIAVSIDKQRLKVFDANGVWAESPVSTGTRSNPTPTGVFSIIQKNKWHRSNLYSGAPMPYMQRITWSGVALHAGVLPGYPASHGCIRLPGDFAARMWGWTKLGARVIIAPGESEPVDIIHPRLIARIITPPPEEMRAGAPGNAGDQTDAPGNSREVTPDATKRGEIELRLTPIDDDREPSSRASRASVRTADASGTVAFPVEPDVSPRQAAPRQTIAQMVPTPDSIWLDAPPRDVPAEAPPTAQPSSPAPDQAPADKKKEAAVKKRTGHVAAFISRKEGKLFVRQGFDAWFDVPVAIVDPDRPLGTHVFTAHKAGQSDEYLRWTVVTVPPRPQPAPTADQSSRRRGKNPPKIVAAPPSLPPSNALEALDRVAIPPEALERIATAIGAGGSLTISDQGLGSETGKGTDFIVLTR